MNWTKDRYTVFLLAATIYFSFILYYTVKINKLGLGISIALLAIHAAYVTNRKTRLHIEDGFTGRLMLKGENDKDGFKLETSRKNLKDMDGICLEGRRYKTRDGTDVCIDKDGNLKPCGFGSYLVNLTGGGWEPAAIQNDDHWKGCKE